MALDSGITRRFVVPRWRPTDDPIGISERILLRRSASSAGWETEAFNAWNSQQSLSTASEAVCAAIVSEQTSAFAGAARYILDRAHEASPSQLRMASIAINNNRDILDVDIDRSDGEQRHRDRIKKCKQSLRINPVNPLTWIDQAFSYLCLGEISKSIDCATTAHTISPENRLIIRAISRLWHHLDDPERALAILRSSALVHYDPWVTAAEIAISESAGIKSVMAKRAGAMISSSDFSPAHLTELSSALASLELDHGKDKAAKALFKKSLERPNENALAQAQASKLRSVLDLEELNRSTPGSHESVCRQRYNADNFPESLGAAEKWHSDQPFSAAPAIFASYLASVGMDDYEKSIRLSDGAIKAAPCHFLLHNNKAFGLASLGRTNEARDELRKIPREIDDTDKAVLCATTGLILYREGSIDAGRALYAGSIKYFRKLRDNKTFLSCAFWLREEMTANGDKWKEAYMACKDSSPYITDPAARRLWKRLKAQAEKRGLR